MASDCVVHQVWLCAPLASGRRRRRNGRRAWRRHVAATARGHGGQYTVVTSTSVHTTAAPLLDRGTGRHVRRRRLLGSGARRAAHAPDGTLMVSDCILMGLITSDCILMGRLVTSDCILMGTDYVQSTTDGVLMVADCLPHQVPLTVDGRFVSDCV